MDGLTMDESKTPMVCPYCYKNMTECKIENPEQVFDHLTGWQCNPPIDAWYCEKCKLVVADPDIPF